MLENHPVFKIKAQKSKVLLGKKVVLGVTGSIAAVKTIEISRELIRHGADVYSVMSKDAAKIIHPSSLHLATGREAVTKLTGQVEHVAFFSEAGIADLFLIAPCTANTIGKIACGIGDTTVTTFALVALGSKIPIVIVPAMDGIMYKNPIFKQNLKKLKNLGINIAESKLEEEKAKILSKEKIVEIVIKSFSVK